MQTADRWTLVVALDSVGAAGTIVRGDGSQEVLTVEGSHRIDPSVAVDGGGLLVAGPAAVPHAEQRPEWTLLDPMQRLESPNPVVLGRSRHAPTEVVATVIRFFARLGAARVGRPAAAVLVSCPEWWHDHVRSRLESAAAAAGFTDCRVVGAATAAAAEVRARRGSTGSLVVLDVQAAEVVVSAFDRDEPLGVPARLQTWGVDLVDEQLGDAIAARLDPDAGAAALADPGFRRDVRRVRRELGAGADAAELTWAGSAETVRRFELAAIVADLVESDGDALRMALSDREVGFDTTIRVAGVSLPGVAEGLAAVLPMAEVDADHPELAALYGIALAGRRVPTPSPVPIPVSADATNVLPTAGAPTMLTPAVVEPAPVPTPPPGLINPTGAGGEEDGDRGRAVLIAVAALLGAVVLGLGAFALTRGDDVATTAADETEVSTTTATTEATTTTEASTTTTTEATTTTTEPTTTTTEPTTTEPPAELASVLLTDADLAGWSPSSFQLDTDSAICGIPAVAQPARFDGRSWTRPNDDDPDNVGVYTVSHWIEEYSSVADAIAVYERDVEVPDLCGDDTIEIAGEEFAVSLETNTTDFDDLGDGDIVVLSGVLFRVSTGDGTFVLSTAQRLGPHYSVVQLSSNQPLGEETVDEYVELIRQAFENSADILAA
ncbi:MAG: Hsp70 family protein [Acidimicrobiales bacterium]